MVRNASQRCPPTERLDANTAASVVVWPTAGLAAAHSGHHPSGATDFAPSRHPPAVDTGAQVETLTHHLVSCLKPPAGETCTLNDLNALDGRCCCPVPSIPAPVKRTPQAPALEQHPLPDDHATPDASASVDTATQTPCTGRLASAVGDISPAELRAARPSERRAVSHRPAGCMNTHRQAQCRRILLVSYCTFSVYSACTPAA
jgi:hypothetical protein